MTSSDTHDHNHRSPGHVHRHGHSHAPADFGKAFAIGITLNAALVGAEVLYGILGHSLALLADAGHNLSDVLGLVAAWGAAYLSKRQPGGRYTYGLRSTTILAALANAVVLLIVTGGIGWEALRRFMTPEEPVGLTIIAVAGIGIAINGFTALLFLSGRNADLNIQGAFLHMASDAVVSAGVVAAGAVIFWTGWVWLDPAVSIGVSIIIIVGTWSLLRSSVSLALHAVPEGIDQAKVREYLASVPGVTAIHDLHIWGMSTTETALTAHLVRPEGATDALLHDVCHELEERFGISHATLQLETAAAACGLAPDEVV